MERRQFLQLAGAGAVSLLSPGLGMAQAVSRKPNIVVILADDLGYCDTELYGCDRIPTPNIKSIAEKGVLFTDGYVTNPVCSPSRASFLTGRYQQRFGFEYNTGPLRRDFSDGLGLPLAEITLPDTLKKAGYTTGMVGKWHLGTRPKFHPIRRGFDEFFGFTFGGNMYIDPNRPDVRNYFRNGRTNMPDWNGRSRFNPIVRGATVVEEEDYLTDAFTREAVAFIEHHHKEPFFLYVPYNAPHTPLQATLKYYNRFPHIKDERERIYAAMVSALDDGVGEILRKIRQHGLEKDTMVIFLSDNGCALYTKACSNLPLRLGKMAQFEGGVRVPFAMMWPGHMPAKRVYDSPVSALDIFPTTIAAANGEISTDSQVDGVNLLPYLNNKLHSAPHEYLFWRNGPNWAVRKGNWKLFAAEGHYWLYDLSKDLGEMTNLAEKQADVRKGLQAAFEKWNAQLKEPLWPPRGKVPVIIDGVSFKWHV
ncbi:MAG: sulfatase-like hydrolase/transferase [Deltaproteobacteria bacterium]|nr:sulfatase-like hydrolase/transferase [Deltaproteobacteria bacterium]